MHKSWLIVFERLFRPFLALDLGLKSASVVEAFPLQKPDQTGPRRLFVDKLTGHSQQIIHRQEQRFTQLTDDPFLCARQRGFRAVRTMRAVLQILTVFPLADGCPRGVVFGRQGPLGQRRGLDLGTDFRCRSRICVDGMAHAPRVLESASISSRKTSRASNNTKLREDTETSGAGHLEQNPILM